MPHDPSIIRCDQAVRPGGVEACCVTEIDPCFKPAQHRHIATGIALCEGHWENAMTMGGPQDGHWQVGMRIIPFPDGWEDLPDPETPLLAPATLWVEPAKTVGGVIVEL